jgi:thiol-disulfide isomerase/thioredoxin
MGLVLFLLCILLNLSHASPEAVITGDEVRSDMTLSLFWREECGHCKREKEFLSQLQKELPHLKVKLLNIDQPEIRQLFDALTDKFHLAKVTPITLIGQKFIVGFAGPDTTGSQIRELLQTERMDTTVEQMLEMNVAGDTEKGGVCPLTGPSTACGLVETGPFYFDIPLLGSVNLTEFTLPMLSVVLGLVDGFNPCAMWVLVAFLTALAHVGSLRRMVQFAGLFILAQGVMYLLILNSWFLAFDFIKADRIVTPLVGLLAIGGGIFFLWEFVTFEGTCKVTSLEKRTQTVSRLQSLAHQSLTPLVVLGILGIAFSVNVVEFACSIGIPQAYTKILDMNNIGILKREALMGIYIWFYMLDDLVVFVLAIWSIEKIGLTARYSRATNFVGGIIMLILGVLLLVAPEKLRF